MPPLALVARRRASLAPRAVATAGTARRRLTLRWRCGDGRGSAATRLPSRWRRGVGRDGVATRFPLFLAARQWPGRAATPSLAPRGAASAAALARRATATAQRGAAVLSPALARRDGFDVLWGGASAGAVMSFVLRGGAVLAAAAGGAICYLD